jgi:hypothetical protein
MMSTLIARLMRLMSFVVVNSGRLMILPSVGIL